MAGKGPLPKDPATRRRRNTTRTTKITPDGKLHGPSLPPGIDWHDQTRIWWDNWRRSPQASSLQPVEWDFLLDTARIHSEFWLGDTSVAGELRLRVAKFGATMEDRLRLHLEATQQPETTKKARADKSQNPATERRKAALRLVTGDEEAG